MLIEAGVPKSQIVLGFRHPSERAFLTGLAVVMFCLTQFRDQLPRCYLDRPRSASKLFMPYRSNG
ncbi:MAG: hypothetical protein R3E95_09490 [Thiolinea sp.]